MMITRNERIQRTKGFSDRFVILLLTVYYAMTYILANVTWGRFVLAGSALLIFLIYVIKNRGKIKLHFYSLHGCILLFTVYTFLSSIWAWTPSLSLDKAQSLLELLLISSLMFLYVYENLSVDDSLDILLWGGIIIAFYSLLYYGLNGLIALLSTGSRMNTEFENVNSLSMCWVISIIIAIYKVLHERRIWLLFAIIGMVLLVAAAASRKAFISLLVGVLMVFFLKYKGKNGIQTFIRFFFLGVVLLIVIYYLLQLPVFEGILNRMEGFTAFFSGGGGYQGQAESRYRYIQIGIEQWKKTPILGIGIANSYTLLGSSGERNTYLHNNFVELLACGGIIGFSLFYIRYYQLVVRCTKNIKKNKNNELDWLILTIVFILLLVDYGAVSYTTKQHYMQIMLLYLYIYGQKCE